MASAFDPNTFAQMTYTEATSTEVAPVPATEYPATLDSYKITTWEAKDGSSSGLKGNFMWKIEGNPEVTEATGREVNMVRQEIMFDLTDNGMLDFGKGKNVKLGRMRVALDCNKAGEVFSFDMLVGRQGMIRVGHRPDQRDSSIVYAEVKDVAHI